MAPARLMRGRVMLWWGPAPFPCWPPVVMVKLLSSGNVGGPCLLVGIAVVRARMAERVASCEVLVEGLREGSLNADIWLG